MNKVALVTGAQRSDNFARARMLAQQGLHVVVAAPEWSKAVDAALRLQLEGLSAEALHLTRRDADALEAARRQIVSLHGRLDVVVDDGEPALAH
ncbi:SDR family NAD(P)-dependent oxidoreductase [Solimonas terrae]|uniref:SDR family NAD(P)-dependent oxidoreductase n=1 Tax=Solimonas terrae TaxID=1396819 RepID=A0A6M2BS86_9GAMM|nr:SDR family NAD(P)-dependent oxidoreductase [Solimonas terrae]NGY05214.1 SDR family NAD(P)-dependent oxidoreductase [Solimonas terrae]